MAEEFSKRATPLERWDAPDPNRKMALEETPWLEMAKGGRDAGYGLVNVLDPRIAKRERELSIKRLEKAQTATGGFPWFPGGPPSPYITLYILYGFSKSLEFGVEAPKNMIKKAWSYLHRHYIDEVVRTMIAEDRSWEFVTFLNYTLSNYPDSSWWGDTFSEKERKEMLDFSFKHWKEHSPYMKGYLSLTLNRMGRKKDALLVWQSVMDSAKTDEVYGTHWAPEDRAWLWYNDTIETHAFAIRTLLELMPEDSRIHGLIQWIFLNKKMNHWKSTRTTAEVIYSLIHYLKGQGAIGIREEALVSIGQKRFELFFEPDKYSGKKNQIVIAGSEIDPDTMSKIVVEKRTKGILFASSTWHFSTEKLPEEERGDLFSVSRIYFKRERSGKGFALKPIDEGNTINIGDEVEVHLSIKVRHPAEYVHLRDPRPAGFEPQTTTSGYKWDLGIYWYEEVRDSGQNFFFESLPQGEYRFKYRIRANMAGRFKTAPATIQSMYAPEFSAYSKGHFLEVK